MTDLGGFPIIVSRNRNAAGERTLLSPDSGVAAIPRIDCRPDQVFPEQLEARLSIPGPRPDSPPELVAVAPLVWDGLGWERYAFAIPGGNSHVHLNLTCTGPAPDDFGLHFSLYGTEFAGDFLKPVRATADPLCWEFAIDVPGLSLARREAKVPLTIAIVPAVGQTVAPDEPYPWPVYLDSGWTSDDSSSGGCDDCVIEAVTPGSTLICQGEDVTFHAEGLTDPDCSDCVTWSAPGGSPNQGQGQSFETHWDQVGQKTITSFSGYSSGIAFAEVVAIEKVIVEGSDPENEGPITVPLGLSVNLQAKRVPPPADGPWPHGGPQWEISDKPSDFFFGRLISRGVGKVTFYPDEVGTWKVKASLCDSADEIEINAVAGCDSISDVSADKCYQRVDQGQSRNGRPMNVVGPASSTTGDVVTLTLTLDASADRNKITWVGATQDANDPLKATVPIDQSALRQVTVRYDGEDCRDIYVWPVWATVTIRISGELSPENKSPFLNNGNWPQAFGGGKKLGPDDQWQNPNLTSSQAVGKIEAVASLSPPGVGSLIPDGKLAFRRRRTAIAWDNGGHYVSTTWQSGPSVNVSDAVDSSDQDLIDLNPTGDELLFDVDAPGLTVNEGFHTGEMYVNFIQYVTWDCGQEKLCSNEANWSYQLRIDIDKTSGNVELNQLGTSHIDLPDEPYYEKR